MGKIISALLGSMSAPCMCSCSAAQQNASAPPAVKTGNASGKCGPDKKSILVVSFGTSCSNAREASIRAIEKNIKMKFPGYDVRRAFTSQAVINKLKKRDNIHIDNVVSAMKRLVKGNAGTLIVQPTHIINGYEYDGMCETVNAYKSRFKFLRIGYPLLNSEDDYAETVKAVAADIPQIKDRKTAVILVGHGTKHFANSAYAALDFHFKRMGYKNVFVGTVESYPDIGCLIKEVKNYGAKKVFITPFMVTAGSHADNDICGDKSGSWEMAFKEHGFEVASLKKGLGEYANIRDLYAGHVKDAIGRFGTKEASI